MAVRVGLAENEVVIRGGGLKGPTIFDDCEVVDGRVFVALRKKSPVLITFLTGKSSWKNSTLTRTSTLDALAALRDKVRAKALIDATKQSSEEDRSAVLLGEDFAAPTLRPRTLKKRAVREVPGFAEVTLVRDGLSPWNVLVTLSAGNTAVAIEATQANMERLLEFVRREIEEGLPDEIKKPLKRPQHRTPRGPPGRRQYWRNDRERWVEKVLSAPEASESAFEVHEDTSASFKKSRRASYRTISRKPSDCTVPPPKRARVSACPPPVVQDQKPEGSADVDVF
jgi:hypothetical protein